MKNIIKGAALGAFAMAAVIPLAGLTLTGVTTSGDLNAIAETIKEIPGLLKDPNYYAAIAKTALAGSLAGAIHEPIKKGVERVYGV